MAQGVYNNQIRDEAKRKKTVVITCACGCGKTINKYDQYYRKRKTEYGHRNKSEEVRKKFSRIRKGKKFSKEVCANIRFGKLGSKNPNWIDGRANEEYGEEFNNKLKERIRQRDKYKCQGCGVAQEKLKRRLPIHHIDYNKKNNKESNLISVCISCNAKANFNRKDWIDYYHGKLNNRVL